MFNKMTNLKQKVSRNLLSETFGSFDHKSCKTSWLQLRQEIGGEGFLATSRTGKSLSDNGSNCGGRCDAVFCIGWVGQRLGQSPNLGRVLLGAKLTSSPFSASGTEVLVGS